MRTHSSGGFPGGMTLSQFLLSDFFWTTVVGTWLAQLLGTVITRRKPKSVLFWRVIRALHGLFDKIDPPGPTVVTKISAAGALFALAFLGACTPAHTIDRWQVLNGAINITDTAVSAAITADSDFTDRDSERWGYAVNALDNAVKAAKARKGACEALPGLILAARDAECNECVETIVKASEALSCAN